MFDAVSIIYQLCNGGNYYLNVLCYFLIFHIFHIRPNLWSIFFYYRRLEHFKIILRISKVFGLRGGATEIRVTNGKFLAMSENFTNVYACCSCKLIFNNEWIYSQFGLSFNYNVKTKNWTIPYFIIFIIISKRDHFAVRGPSSFKLNSLFQILKFVITIFSNLL